MDHMHQYPGANQATLITALACSPEGMETSAIIPSLSRVKLLHGHYLWPRLNTWAINMVGPKNFASKWYVGRARPEETAWSVHCTIIRHINDATDVEKEACDGAIHLNLADIPDDIQESVAEMNLTHMQSFGAYEEGSPTHPSWPAMHSASSCMSVWLPIVADISDAQLLQVKRMDLAVSFARTVAGVHYYDDNIAGLTMGQKIIKRELPGFLESAYGADPAEVIARLEAYDFDWKQTAADLLGDYTDYDI
jgi:hypothetical protein